MVSAPQNSYLLPITHYLLPLPTYLFYINFTPNIAASWLRMVCISRYSDINSIILSTFEAVAYELLFKHLESVVDDIETQVECESLRLFTQALFCRLFQDMRILILLLGRQYLWHAPGRICHGEIGGQYGSIRYPSWIDEIVL